MVLRAVDDVRGRGVGPDNNYSLVESPFAKYITHKAEKPSAPSRKLERRETAGWITCPGGRCGNGNESER